MKAPSNLCDRARAAWNNRFDGGGPMEERWQAHLQACPACRDYTAGAEAARRMLRSRELPPPNPTSDAAILAALDARRQSGIPGALGLRDLRRLLLVGASVFALTLTAGSWLSHPPANDEPVAAPGPLRARELPLQEPRREADLDAWLERPDLQRWPTQTTPPARSRKGVPFQPPREESHDHQIAPIG